MGINWRHNGPFFDVSEDSVVMNNVRIEITKSEDSTWHMDLEKMSRGNTTGEAKKTAEEINFQFNQKDSQLILGRGFSITPKQQFRNQQVMVVIKMPVGKRIYLSENLDEYHWFTMNRKWRNRGVNTDWEFTDDHENNWDADVEYIMTEHGLERTSKNLRTDGGDENQNNNAVPDSTQKKKDNKGDYRYHKPKTANAVNMQDSPEKINNKNPESTATLVLLTNLS
jgi:hypothetical protein